MGRRSASLNIHEPPESSVIVCDPPGGRNKVGAIAVTVATGQARQSTRQPGGAERHRPLTDADGDVGRPLVVVLAGDALLPDQLEAKLALKPQDAAVGEAVALAHAVQGRAGVAATLLVDFCRGSGKK